MTSRVPLSKPESLLHSSSGEQEKEQEDEKTKAVIGNMLGGRMGAHKPWGQKPGLYSSALLVVAEFFRIRCL